jgi:predicted metal-dependent hydrolase
MLETTHQSHVLDLPGGRATNISVRRSNRARRIILRVVESEPGIELVVPKRVALREALKFADQKSAWFAARLAERPPGVAFVPGAVLPHISGELTLVPRTGTLRDAERTGALLVITGPEHTFAASVGHWLKEDARAAIRPQANSMAKEIRHKLRRIQIGDPATRWGSCSSTGTLSFSWRLVMAPAEVLEYVVAHEVAHLAELNHGKRFWSTVDLLVDDAAAPRRWLRTNGAKLRRYGEPRAR